MNTNSNPEIGKKESNITVCSCEVVEKIREKLEKIPWVRTQEQFTKSVYAKLQKYCKEVAVVFEDADIFDFSVTCKTHDGVMLVYGVAIKYRPRFNRKELGKLYDVLKDFDGYEIVDGLDVKNLNDTINASLQSMGLPYRIKFEFYQDAENLSMVFAELQNVPIGGYFVLHNIMYTGELTINNLDKGTERVVTIPMEFAPNNVISNKT
jgi:ABC-type antimicrobial peptide transport system permease subunit